MASLRVGVITYDWYPYEVRALRLSEAAANAGNEVHVVSLRLPGEKRYEVHNGVRVHRMPLSRGVGGSLPKTIAQWVWFMLLAAFTITRLHLRRRFDVIHAHNMPDFLVFAALIPRLLGAKVILDVQDVSPELMSAKAKGSERKRKLVVRLATLQEKLSTSFAHYVLTVGWPFEKLLLQRGVPQKKLSSILNSADPSLFPPERRYPLPYESSAEPVETRPFIFMYYGTLAERNGLDIAVRALAIALKEVPQLRLDIQGNGDQLPYLKQLVGELGLEQSVIFSGSCRPDQLVDFIVHGDVGIIPYRSDGFADLVLPTKAYEFAWMHRPMISSDTHAMRSLFKDESVVFCNPEQPESFAAAMVDLYRQPERRARLIESASEDYTAYRWEAMAEKYQELLLRLSGKQPKQAEQVKQEEQLV